MWIYRKLSLEKFISYLIWYNYNIMNILYIIKRNSNIINVTITIMNTVLLTPKKLSVWLSSLPWKKEMVFVCCLTSQQHASVSQGWICSDNCTCCHTEIEVADPTFYLTQSQYTDSGPTSPTTDPITPSTWQGSHWSANFEVIGMTWPGKILSQVGFEPQIFCSQSGHLNH